jgi:hypothetical protein
MGLQPYYVTKKEMIEINEQTTTKVKYPKKPCKHCKYFYLWGVSTGYCTLHEQDFSTWEHCKYYKRDRKLYTKDGKCKYPENEYY